MFGPKISTVFTSRWKALLWSAGILMTAYCTVPSADEAADPQQSAEAEAALKVILGQKPGSDKAHPTNPWAKDAP